MAVARRSSGPGSVRMATARARTRPLVAMMRAVHRFLRILSVALITAGLVILADVGLTLAWKEPLSIDLRLVPAGRGRGRARRRSRTASPAGAARARSRATTDVAERARSSPTRSRSEVERGRGIGRIEIPAIDLDVVVVEGTDTASLQKGPGHYTLADNAEQRELGDGSAFPGQGKTIGIAGPPHHLPGAVPADRRDPARRRDHAADAVRDLHLRGREERDRRPRARSRWSRTSATSRPRADRLPPALQRRPALRRSSRKLTDVSLFGSRRSPMAGPLAGAAGGDAVEDRASGRRSRSRCAGAPRSGRGWRRQLPSGSPAARRPRTRRHRRRCPPAREHRRSRLGRRSQASRRAPALAGRVWAAAGAAPLAGRDLVRGRLGAGHGPAGGESISPGLGRSRRAARRHARERCRHGRPARRLAGRPRRRGLETIGAPRPLRRRPGAVPRARPRRESLPPPARAA